MGKIAWLLLTFIVSNCIHAADYQVVKDGPVHEAYIIQEYGNLPLQAISSPPPQKITELVPEQTDSKSVWLPGYWAWSTRYGKYLWVSGLWRRPPPGGKQWILGEWKKTTLGWVWLKGFWSSIPSDHLTYLENPPGDFLDEKIPMPPNPAASYFWIPGYWSFNTSSKQYVWYPGRWAPLEPHWVYFPPQYIWREEGYVFNPAYWDWPVDDRGLAFASISIDPGAIKTIVYEPLQALHELFIIENLFPQWPNYYCLFRYHYFFHHDLWTGWGAIPTWWNWPTWWCYPWQDLWALWWWWSHPGYPNPVWLDRVAADSIAPPPEFLIKMMASIKPPLYIAANGVVSMQKLLQVLGEVTSQNLPIIPNDSRLIEYIQKSVNPQPPSRIIKPNGTGVVKNPPPKPFFGPSKETLKVLPQKPQTQTYTPPFQQQNNFPQTISPAYRDTQQGYRLHPYPPQSMQSQHRNHFMNRHQHQTQPNDAVIPNLYDGQYLNRPYLQHQE